MMYSINRETLAEMIASHTSGIEDSIPEQMDFDLADEVLALIEKRITEDVDNNGSFA